MTAHFWRVLEGLGCTGNAAHDWRVRLAGDWEQSRGLLRPGTAPADTVIDPERPDCRLQVVPDGKTGHLGIAEDEPLRGPLRLSAEDVAILQPDWAAIAGELGARLGFVDGAWKANGLTRQIGIAQHRTDPPRPVVLHLPAGAVGDVARLVDDVGQYEDSIILIPSARCFTPGLKAVQIRNRLSIRSLAEHFELLAAGQVIPPISTTVDTATTSARKRHRPVLHPQPGWRWAMVRIEVAFGGRLILTCDGQRGEFRFPKSNGKNHSLGFEIMLRLAVEQKWRNPRSDAPDHNRVRRRFYRLAKLLGELVDLPDSPFHRERRRFIPKFRVGLHRDLDRWIPDNQEGGGR